LTINKPSPTVIENGHRAYSSLDTLWVYTVQGSFILLKASMGAADHSPLSSEFLPRFCP